MTDYEYDDAGRLLRSVTQREPEFSEDDVAELIAIQAMRRDTGRYGESREEAMSDEADPMITEGDTFVRYVVGHRVNHAEAAVELYRAEHKDLPPGAELFVERKEFRASSANQPE